MQTNISVYRDGNFRFKAVDQSLIVPNVSLNPFWNSACGTYQFGGKY